MKTTLAMTAAGLLGLALSGCLDSDARWRWEAKTPPLTAAQEAAHKQQEQEFQARVQAFYANKIWTYWGIAPDGVTVLQSDDFGLIADSDGRYSGSLTDAYGHYIAGGRYGALTEKDGGHIWTIINSHFYQVQ
jgi:hypothetical protein